LKEFFNNLFKKILKFPQCMTFFVNHYWINMNF
jgi:hypothetical protein